MFRRAKSTLVSTAENVDSQWSDEIPDGQVVAAELRKSIEVTKYAFN